MVLLLYFYIAFILFSFNSDQRTLQTSIYRPKWKKPRGVRRRVENLSAAHPTDLGPRGACAFRSINPNRNAELVGGLSSNPILSGLHRTPVSIMLDIHLQREIQKL